jgi:hypothetical protein
MNNSENTARAPIGRTLKKREPDTTTLPKDDSSKEQVLLAIAKRKTLPHSIADRIAGSTFHYRNWYYPGGREEFQQNEKLRYVEKMYPFAEGGQLLVDEPTHQFQIDACELKRKFLQSKGFRYVIIRPNQTLEQVVEEFLA